MKLINYKAIKECGWYYIYHRCERIVFDKDMKMIKTFEFRKIPKLSYALKFDADEFCNYKNKQDENEKSNCR